MPKTSYRLKCLHDIEEKISLPELFFTKTESTIEMRYNLSDKPKLIYLKNRIEVANFLRRRGLIESYVIEEDASVTMFKKSLITTVGERGEPIQEAMFETLLWDEVKFTAEMVLSFASTNEFNKVHSGLNRVVSFVTT